MQDPLIPGDIITLQNNFKLRSNDESKTSK